MCLHFCNALHMLKCSYKTILLYNVSVHCSLLWVWSGTAHPHSTPSMPLFGLQIQHSPSICTKSKHGSEHEDFVTGKCFGEYVSRHVGCGAVYEFHHSILDGLTDEVVTNVDILHACMKLVIIGKRYG